VAVLSPQPVSPRLVVGLALCALLAAAARAERLPVRAYTSADGLPQDTVSAIVQDAAGQLFVGTEEGLARFDGGSFVTYGVREGLGSPKVNDLMFTRDGCLWIGTIDGVFRFNPAGPPLFSRASEPSGLPSPLRIWAIAEDRRGRIWVGSDAGLLRLETSDGPPRLSAAVPEIGATVEALSVGPDGTMWIGSQAGLFRLDASAERPVGPVDEGLAEKRITSMLADRRGRLWVGTRLGLCRMSAGAAASGRAACEALYAAADGLGSGWINTLLETRDGTIYVGSDPGLARLNEGAPAGGATFHKFGPKDGITGTSVLSLREDRDGNIWVGTEDGGLIKIARGGLVAYGADDGLVETRIGSIFEDVRGDLLVFSGSAKRRALHVFDGERFRSVLPGAYARFDYLGWGWNQIIAQDLDGGWWLPTGRGLLHYPKLRRVEDLATAAPVVYTMREGLGSEDVFRLFVDRPGNLWISATGAKGNVVTVRDRATGIFRTYGAGSGWPGVLATSFAEDPGGAVWAGLYTGGLVRFDGGRLEAVAGSEKLPSGRVDELLFDRRGRLWAATRGGLVRVDDPSARPLAFRLYTRADGLSGDIVSSVGEDVNGILYLGTGGGVTRLDPETGSVRRYTTADGLPQNFVSDVFRDRRGAFWFGTRNGLARLTPEADPPIDPPPIFIDAVEVAGEPRRVSAFGDARIEGLTLPATRNRIRIAFRTVVFKAGEAIGFQYRLDDSGPWSPASPQGSVLLDRLAPGRYRFEVRAVTADGLASRIPAVVSFEVTRPWWRTAWFLGVAALLVTGAIYLAHRTRVARAVAIERVRTHIATDLHDDIGSSLSQIAILSEVALARLRRGDEDAAPLVRTAAESARELVDTMSDVVWAVDPRRDHLDDLVQRMRRFVEGLCAARGIGLRFTAPEDGPLRLGAPVRRQAFLVFKESVNNALKHSGCANLEAGVRHEGRVLVIRVRDDGRGFDLDVRSEGNGLPSMRRRSEVLGGTLRIASRPGEGTEVVFRVPV